ncbi:MAG: DUF481 domain-containing protein [PVC group bacterium]|nr:DUF481 domain-containing protein [PVC group bacterium]
MKNVVSIMILGLLILGIAVPANAQREFYIDVTGWDSEASLGYNRATGNTQSSQLAGAIEATRKKDGGELTVKASTLYSSQNKKMDGQKHSASVRSGFNFWDAHWYGFMKFEAEHDRFANIDYRLLPSAGAGYWFLDTENWKSLFEVGLGLEHTEYSNNAKEATDVILIPRVFVEKSIFANSTLSQEIILYPNLEQGDQYRMRAETKFTNPLSEEMSLRCSFIDEYNSDPSGDIKKNDTRMIMSLVYSF